MKWREKIREADGFIICTPEYNHGYPAVLKNALDYVYFVWGRKAVAFVSWGGTGGTRGVEQLRLVAVELDMVPIRWAVHIPNPWFIQDVSGDRHRPEQPGGQRAARPPHVVGVRAEGRADGRGTPLRRAEAGALRRRLCTLVRSRENLASLQDELRSASSGTDQQNHAEMPM